MPTLVTETKEANFSSPVENAQFFSILPLRQQFDLTGPDEDDEADPRQFRARWWPAPADTSRTR